MLRMNTCLRFVWNRCVSRHDQVLSPDSGRPPQRLTLLYRGDPRLPCDGHIRVKTYTNRSACFVLYALFHRTLDVSALVLAVTKETTSSEVAGILVSIFGATSSFLLWAYKRHYGRVLKSMVVLAVRFWLYGASTRRLDPEAGGGWRFAFGDVDDSRGALCDLTKMTFSLERVVVARTFSR